MAVPLRGKKLSIVFPTIASIVASYNTAVGSGISTPIQTALTKLYRQAKTYGVWDDILLLNLFLNDTEQSKFNVKDPTAFKLGYPNGITVTAQGIQADGISQYYTTGFKPATDASTYLSDFGIDLFVQNTSASGTNYMLGVSDNGAITIGFQQSAPVEMVASTNVFVNTGTSTAVQYGNMQGYALLTLQRVGDLVQLFENGQKVNEVTVPVASLPANGLDMFGFCKNTNGNPFSFSAGTHKHLVIRKSLSDTNVQLWNQALLEYHIGIGRIGKVAVFQGDSITHGMNVANGAYPEIVCNTLGLFKQNFALSGSRMSEFMDMTNRAAWWVPTYNAAVHSFMSLALGTNDRVQSMSGTTYGTYLTAYLNLAISRGWPPSKLYVIPRFYQKADTQAALELDYYNAAVPICQSFGVKLIDMYTFMKNSTSPDTTLFPGADNVHPNDAGQVFIGNTFISQL